MTPALDIDAMPWMVEPAEPVAPPPPTAALEWRLDRDPPVPLGGSDFVPLGRFSSWLHQARVLDPYAIELPGAAVMLPTGVAMVGLLERVVREQYGRAGYEEVDFPHLVPLSAMERTQEVFGLRNSLLLVGDDDDWDARRPRAALSPTGESSVYTFWAHTIRSRRDLPQRIFRRTRYYRPAKAGRSLLKGIEASDVFEFQSCTADASANTVEFDQALEMCRRVCAALWVPVLGSTRPPWTNQASVAERCVGLDVPLPHGATLQIGCLYDQGERFSRPYGVTWRDGDGRQHHTRHVAGCLTRRLLLAHIFLGLDVAGELLVHPVLAPVQVGITVHTIDPLAHEWAYQLYDRLGSTGIRVALAGLPDRRRDLVVDQGGELAPGAQQRLWRRQGLPLRVFVHAARSDARPHVVVVRADTREEAIVDASTLARAEQELTGALAAVGHGYAMRAHRFVSSRTQAADADTVRDVLRERRVAVCSLEPNEAAVRTVAQWRQGEVIGFRQASASGACIVSGRPTRAVAYISPRT
jgi:hypothetical protein